MAYDHHMQSRDDVCFQHGVLLWRLVSVHVLSGEKDFGQQAATVVPGKEH